MKKRATAVKAIVPIEKSEQIKAAVLAVDPDLYLSDCVGCLLIADGQLHGGTEINIRVYPNHYVTYEVRNDQANVVAEPGVSLRAARILVAVHEAIK